MSDIDEKYPPIKCTTEWGIKDVHAERERQNMSKSTNVDKALYS